MKIKYLFPFVVFAVLFSACEDETAFSLSGDQDPEPYFFNIGEDSPANIRDKGAINIIAATSDGTETRRPSIHVSGALYTNEREPATYSSLTINNVPVRPVTTADQPGVNPAGKIFGQFFDLESETPVDEYNGMYSLFAGGQVDLDLRSDKFGSLVRQISTPVLRNVKLDETPGYNGTRAISSENGLVLKWETRKGVFAKGSSLEDDIAIALVYYADETIREEMEANEEMGIEDAPTSYPKESKVYSVITENDGEHTIDPALLRGFPGGGTHRVTLANGVRYNFAIDDNDNTIQVTTGTIVTSDDFTIEHCDGAIVFNPENCE